MTGTSSGGKCTSLRELVFHPYGTYIIELVLCNFKTTEWIGIGSLGPRVVLYCIAMKQLLLEVIIP
jgi:hypothetical protein